MAVSDARMGVETALIPIPIPLNKRSTMSDFHASDLAVPSSSKFWSSADPKLVAVMRIAAMKMAPLLPAI